MIEHTVKTMTDHLAQTEYRNERWAFAYSEVEPGVSGQVVVDLMTAGERDATLVMASNDYISFGWCSDPELEFTKGVHRLNHLTPTLCDAVERLTGLSMEEARA